MDIVEYEDILAEIKFLILILRKVIYYFNPDDPEEKEMLDHLQMIIEDRILQEIAKAVK